MNNSGYAADGSRLVCGVVAVSKDKRKILVVESTQRKNHWVLPKGGFETDEAKPEDAALRVFLLLIPTIAFSMTIKQNSPNIKHLLIELHFYRRSMGRSRDHWPSN